MSARLPAASPYVSPESLPFWNATRERRLVLPRCEECGLVFWYPRRFCPQCSSRRIAWQDAAGTGVIYSFTIVRVGPGKFREHAPYAVAVIELDEGPRLTSNVIGTDVEALAIGQRVRVVFDATEEGAMLPRFTPIAAVESPAD